MAVPWRALFVGTTFIGVTGSHGKTTTTMLLARMLHFRASTHVGLWFNEATAVVRVLNQDFARVDLLQHFDLAIGNPPFSDRTMRSDPAFRPLALRLHD